jgi:hypothetical protein
VDRRAWLERLNEQLPGWHVWCSSPAMVPGQPWGAVPAPDDIGHTDALELPHRVNAATPQGLRTLCRERYGWHDYCESCGVLARECGHRAPESRAGP